MAEQDPSKNGGEEPNEVDQRIDKLGKAVQGLTNLVNQQMNRVGEQDETLKKLNENLENMAQKSTPAATDDGGGDEVDLTDEDGNLDPQKFNKFVRNAVNDAVKPINDEIKQTRGAVSNNQLEQEYKELKQEREDAERWVPEMRKLVEQDAYKNLPLKDLYTIARNKNPDKAQQIDDELEAKRKEEEGKNEDDKDKRKPFGGLTPTSTSPASDDGDDEEGNSMTKAEASQKAWDEVMGDIEEAGFFQQ